jgi:glucose/arabinose dehydrogenase/azurin
MKKLLFLPVILAFLCAPNSRAKDFVVYEGHNGPGKGKHVVFLTGDEEYRSEEGLPQMAKILAERHGFKCTVLFAIDPTDHSINPKVTTNMPGAEALDSADVIVMSLRFRDWPDETMKHFVDAYRSGKPIIALRTSTHAFNYDNHSQSPYAKYSYNSKSWPGGFGKQVLGETWVAHHGAHKKEATRGIVEASAADDPLLRGSTDLFGNSDVYTANPAADAKILVRGAVLSGMNATDPPVDGPKNNPMQPVVWTRLYKNEAGKTNKILCTTMGAATDLLNEGLRRLIVNGVYWGAGLDVPQKADVTVVGDYRPTMYGFDGFVKGVKAADLEGSGDSAPGAAPKRSSTQAPTQLELRPGDHIALIGNTLPDRFQHSGWLESFLYLGHPNLDLVVRNLARAGDEVKLRPRPQGFGTPDDWLKKTQADVILAFFGFNESFHGEAGLEQFKTDLREFLTHTAAQNYSGKGAPRVVLFSPIANEKHQDPNFADPTTNNVHIAKYTEAMKQVAAERGVLFVDLFGPSQKLFADAASKKHSLTINGMHLSDTGDQLIGEVIYKALFGIEAPALNAKQGAGQFDKLRHAIIDKSEMWHSRYRTIDGNNVYGSRAPLAYKPEVGGFVSEWNPPEPYVTNFKVMQDEMSQRDVMTANRDKRVWAVAKGGDLAVDDSNLPPVTKVKSNFPGPNPDETFQFLNAEQAIGKMKVHSGMKVNLFASEEQFPELAKPVQMAWDTKGRLWVAVWPNYPERTPDSKVGDSLLVLEDTNGDGKADKCTHFIDDLNGPTGFQFYKDGVLLMEAPDLWFVRDTHGGTKANSIERVLMGLSSADSHHTANSICLEPGGAIYLSDGVFHRTQVETATGPVRNNDAAIYRYEPRTAKFERYVPYGFANPHGRVFDYWGNDIITDGTGNNSYFAPAFSGHIDYPAKHDGMKEFWDRPSRPCAGTGILTSRQFPPELQGNFLNCNVISFQGIYNVKVVEDGSGLKGITEKEEIVSSTDLNFRPVSVDVGPDGAIYFLDWQNPIIGHMQHHLRDPNRDHSHGRIYRVTYQGRPLMKPPKIDGQPVPALLELLKEPENQVRDWAKIELGKHDTREVVAAAQKWADKLDTKDPVFAHNLTEALWVHQYMNVVNVALLKRVLELPEPHARAAAGRVLCYWRDRVPDTLSIFKTLANDENPRVRLEAVRAASFFDSPEAIDVALAILKHPMDYYLDYTLNETMRQLEPLKKQVLEKGAPIASDNPAGRDFLFHSLKTDELLKLQRSVPVLEAILTRADASDSDRMLALGDLAKARNQNRVTTLVNEINSALGAPREPTPAPADSTTQSSKAKKGKRGRSAPSLTGSMAQQASGANTGILLARLLPLQNPDELKAQTAQLTKVTSAPIPEVRQAGFAALMLADGSIDAQWSKAASSDRQLADVLEAIPMLPDQDFRAKAFDKTAALLKGNGSEPVQRGAIRALVSMHHDYETVFGLLSGLVQRKQLVQAAAQGILSVPRSQWPKAQAEPAAAAFVDWAKTVPTDSRTTPDYVQVIQLAGDLTGLTPVDQAARLRTDLKTLRVAVFLVRSVREQMRYDTTRLVVEAGKPCEIIFENNDFMPHNLVVVAPGVRDKIGPVTPTMRPDQLDDQGRAYLPTKDGVLGATKLLPTGQSESIKLTAPAKEGDYEYFCSYPAHYQLMWGTLVVTKDVDAYLQQHPEVPVQTAPANNPFDEGSPATSTAHKHSH